MLTFEPIDIDGVDWQRLDAFPDRTVYQTLPWLTFIARAQGAEPVVAFLRDGNETLGYFTGLVIKRHGIKMLGSPFPGWTTDYMGFNLCPGVCRREGLAALELFAFRRLGCLHLEIMDRRLTVEDGEGLGMEHETFQTFEIDLRRSKEELLAAMNTNARRYIRRAERTGLIIEEAHDAGFVDDYYAQLRDVFAKQNLIPTYSKERVRLLYECLYPTGRLLLLRARDPDGQCIATGIFPAMNDTMYFWGGASWRQYQYLHPNEPLQWHAMMYWKARGVERYDMSGGGEYKQKYGGQVVCVPWFRKSRYRVISHLRHFAQRLVMVSQRIHGFGKARL